ncbi:hypothetical protein [Janthinobacterium sp. 1_2014MBL_MicDiv]|uniref:hypothetical protein n=1 Tax=Janthinobacterium sp. 1_2014MBL_MicDiv TaxID=1644131 RepID=UPI0012EC1438|nr:hypothetical protein [Janthinobacterium sp. 1_2014MBL_MicDiv]
MTTPTSRPQLTVANGFSPQCGTMRAAGGYTDLPNPCEDIQGHSLAKRTIYITDAVFSAVRIHGSALLRDAMDLAYLSSQRPADALRMTEQDIIDAHLIITQEKNKQPLRITITGELAKLMDRIRARKATQDRDRCATDQCPRQAPDRTSTSHPL